MQILQDREGDATVVAPAGRVDNAAAPALRKVLANLDAGGSRRLVVDFGQVDYISSAGLEVLFQAAKGLRANGGALAICGLGPGVRRVFDLSGYGQDLTIVATRGEAVACVAVTRD